MTIEPVVSPTLPGWIRDHLTRYLETNGEDGYWWDPATSVGRTDVGKMPTLLLTTIGRKSGNPITLPLIFGQDGKNFIIVGSKGGAPEHPAWYLNLLANPHAAVQVKADRYQVRARVAEGEERERLWKFMNSIWHPYDEYQSKTGRKIPVVVLEPQA